MRNMILGAVLLLAAEWAYLYLVAPALAQNAVQPYVTNNSTKKPVGDGSASSVPMPCIFTAP